MRLSLTEIYDARVAAGTLRPDPAQHAVLPVLEDLRHWLEANATRRVGLFAGLFAKPVTPPPGLYLWGGVGRGAQRGKCQAFQTSFCIHGKNVSF